MSQNGVDEIGERVARLEREVRLFKRSAASILALLGTVALTACSVMQPVVVITNDGKTLRGTATATLVNGSFTATDGKVTCGGTYDSLSLDRTISMQVVCSDGRKGIVIATRDSAGGQSGHGTVRLTDGTEGQFIFGPEAENF